MVTLHDQLSLKIYPIVTDYQYLMVTLHDQLSLKVYPMVTDYQYLMVAFHSRLDKINCKSLQRVRNVNKCPPVDLKLVVNCFMLSFFRCPKDDCIIQVRI
jgi:hypothetical protein